MPNTQWNPALLLGLRVTEAEKLTNNAGYGFVEHDMTAPRTPTYDWHPTYSKPTIIVGTINEFVVSIIDYKLPG